MATMTVAPAKLHQRSVSELIQCQACNSTLPATEPAVQGLGLGNLRALKSNANNRSLPVIPPPAPVIRRRHSLTRSGIPLPLKIDLRATRASVPPAAAVTSPAKAVASPPKAPTATAPASLAPDQLVLTSPDSLLTAASSTTSTRPLSAGTIYSQPAASLFSINPSSSTSSLSHFSPTSKPRKPPASHSAQGVATDAGPPPALSFRRSLSLENTRIGFPVDVQQAAGVVIVSANAADSVTAKHAGASADDSTMQSRRASAVLSRFDDGDLTLKAMDPNAYNKPADEEHPQSSSSEDIFLNLAREPARRRVRAELEYPTDGQRASQIDKGLTSPVPSLPLARNSMGPYTPEWSLPPPQVSPPSQYRRPAASAHPLDEGSRVSRLRRYEPAEHQGHRRSPSVTDSASSRFSALRQSRMYHSSPPASINQEQQAPEGTVSTSTTAPSTVWDELDDLKSRIRKLELSGKLPPSSAQAMLPNLPLPADQRPHTAPTTDTTLSSPNREPPSMSPPLDVAGSTSYPQLQSALARAKASMDPEAYSALQSTVSDALSVASLVGSNSMPSGASAVGSSLGVSVSDRLVRRKVDMLCRSLTELCRCLTKEAIDTQEQLSPSRFESRIESRRTSFLGRSPPTVAYSSVGPETLAARRKTREALLARAAARKAEEGAYEESRFSTPLRASTEINGISRSDSRDYGSRTTFRHTRAASSIQDQPRRMSIGTGLSGIPRRLFNRNEDAGYGDRSPYPPTAMQQPYSAGLDGGNRWYERAASVSGANLQDPGELRRAATVQDRTRGL